MSSFQDLIRQGIPDSLPDLSPRDESVSHAPARKPELSNREDDLAVKNALRYFSKKFHPVLDPEFRKELRDYGRIYMYRFRPRYEMKALPIEEYPAQSKKTAAIMLMIMNNLDPDVAQHPHELITYGGNGAVFQNWAQYLLVMKYLSQMTEEQTLVLYSGHPLGLFPSHPEAPRVVVTNGMMIPNYSRHSDWEKYNALGVTQYGQMTAGSFMYIGPQGIVHGTTITLRNAFRKLGFESGQGKVFVSSGLGGMSGAQGKAAVIAGAIGVIAEVNPRAIQKRKTQGWIDEIETDLGKLFLKIETARRSKKSLSIAYQGNVIDLWEGLVKHEIPVELGSDQTSLHNPWSGGYYPQGLSFEDSQKLLSQDPSRFKELVQSSLRNHADQIGKMAKRGMKFFDYGNAFLLEASRAGASIVDGEGEFIYPSYVQDIMGPIAFDYGFGPFRWVCTSGRDEDLKKSDEIAATVLKLHLQCASDPVKNQIQDNLEWIENAKSYQLVVGSKARILYANCQGRVEIARALNLAIKSGAISAPIVLGRDHHDVSGTDSPYRETSNIADGSKFTADMAVQNFVGDAMRGATWVSLHNGGGVGFGEVINGGFGLVIDGTEEAENRLTQMLSWDVRNGLARRAWARNSGAIHAIREEMKRDSRLVVTLPEN